MLIIDTRNQQDKKDKKRQLCHFHVNYLHLCKSPYIKDITKCFYIQHKLHYLQQFSVIYTSYSMIKYLPILKIKGLITLEI